jgi:polysaccharide pyruvyl transferase WcaK-like protein
MTHVPLVLERCLNAKEFFALAAISDEIFSMRLHGLICGVAVGTPVFGLSYDPKVTAFMEQCGLSDACIDFEDENLTDISDFSPRRCQNSDELMRLAWENAKIAVNLLN